MCKNSIKSVVTIWRCAKLAVIIKICQSILIAVFTPLNIYFMQLLIDNIELFIKGRMNIFWCLWIFILLLISTLFLASSGFIDDIINIALRRGVNKNLTTIISEKILTIDYWCFEDKDIADTINRMGRNPQEHILNIFLFTLNTLTDFVAILGMAIVFVQASIWFTVLFFIMIIPMLWFNFKATELMNTLFNDQSIEERELGYLRELLNTKDSLLELKVFGAVHYILTKWKLLSKKVLDERVKTTILSQKYFAASTIINILWAISVVIFLIDQIYYNKISIGIFVALISSIGSLLGLCENLSRTFSSLSREHLVMTHYNKFISLPEIQRSDKEIEIHAPYIVFHDVHFAYPNTNIEVLKGVSMEFNPKQRVALVGENGAGKSTIIKLLCKLYKPDSGTITINGINIDELTVKELKKVYSVVFQDYVTYSLSLRENIAFGDIDKIKDDKAIFDAMEQGMAFEICKKFQFNLDVNLGKIEENGVDLSGGQWQRIAISRACLSESAFVILDEPTSALDPIAENELYETFASLLSKRGCIMISHRLASAKLADIIYVLKDGKIIEKGSHDNLMRNKGTYEHMFSTQSEWYH